MLRKGTAALVAAAAALGGAAPTVHAAEGWRWPVIGELITPYRNGEDPYAGGQHRGIDVAAPLGTPVLAATGGTVRFAGRAGSSGLTVSIRTADGRFDTSYLHLSDAVVREGDRVEGGRRIGAVGSSGRPSAPAPHLHFGVREAGSRHAYRDPLDFLPRVAPPGVREVPRGGPAPVGAPVRVRPAPAPLGRPSPLRRTAPARRRVRVPAARRVRVPAGRRVRLPHGRHAPWALPRPAPAGAPRSAPAPAPHGAAPRALPAPSAGPGPLPAARPGLASAAPRRAPAPATDGGPDLGWALACAGLLLAAACLGRPGNRASGRGANRREASWARLRPLLGRR